MKVDVSKREDLKKIEDFAKELAERVEKKELTFRKARKALKKFIYKINEERDSKKLALIEHQDIDPIARKYKLDLYGAW